MPESKPRRAPAARPTPTDRLADLHRQCDADYARGQRERAIAGESTDLDIAIHVGQRMLAMYGDSSALADVFAYAQAHGGLTEALRILLRALHAEPAAKAGERR